MMHNFLFDLEIDSMNSDRVEIVSEFSEQESTSRRGIDDANEIFMLQAQ